MSRRIWSTTLVVLSLVLIPALAAAQSGGIHGTVTGRVSARPVAGAQVVLAGTAFRTSSDAEGRFVLTGVPAGRYTLVITRIGYEPARRELEVQANLNARPAIDLAPLPTELTELTVIGSRDDLEETRQRLAEIPGAVQLVTARELRATRQANLKDVLRFVPGVYVQPRFGAADESQISIRGSGLRNNFHARGINLLVNGMPYRNADGFTDFESLELLTTEAIEVYKGGNAFRYGGSTLGGAINLTTQTGYTADRLTAVAEGGSFGFYKAQLASGGVQGPFDYYASYAKTGLDGFRQFSQQQRDRLNAHMGYVFGPSLDARMFYFYAHVEEQLPGALTESEFAADPKSAAATNVADVYGRDYDLHHVGLQLRARLSPTQRLEVSPYLQDRDIDHPIFRVISQISRDYGAELRYENSGALGDRGNRFVLGVQPAHLNMANRQFENLQGQHGQRQKDQKDEVTGLAIYAEDVFQVNDRLSLVAGLRYDYSERKSTDFFLTDGDQSDRRTFKPVSPRLGLLVSLPSVNGQVYANATRVYEPPLLLELNSLTIPGFIDLRGQDALQLEVGTRGQSGGLRWDVALFDIELQDEILNSNVEPFPGAGFTVPTYRNADRTRHMGLEVGAQYALPGPLLTGQGGGDALVLRGSYTFSRFTFVRDSVYEGNRLPGAPTSVINAEVKYLHPSGFSLAPTVEWVPGTYFVNSANTVKNRGWTNLGLRAEWAFPTLGVTAFAAGQNLTDQRRASSVQVDNAAGRFLEPMDGRSFYLGMRWGR